MLLESHTFYIKSITSIKKPMRNRFNWSLVSVYDSATEELKSVEVLRNLPLIVCVRGAERRYVPPYLLLV